MTDAGEMIRWVILAIQKVPWLSFEPHVSKVPRTANTIDSVTSITIDSLVLSKFLPQKNQAQLFFMKISLGKFPVLNNFFILWFVYLS